MSCQKGHKLKDLVMSAWMKSPHHFVRIATCVTLLKKQPLMRGLPRPLSETKPGESFCSQYRICHEFPYGQIECELAEGKGMATKKLGKQGKLQGSSIVANVKLSCRHL